MRDKIASGDFLWALSQIACCGYHSLFRQATNEAPREQSKTRPGRRYTRRDPPRGQSALREKSIDHPATCEVVLEPRDVEAQVSAFTDAKRTAIGWSSCLAWPRGAKHITHAVQA